MDAMFHSFYLGIPCLLDRSTSKEVQQHTQTLDLIWSVYGTARTAFSVYCTLPSQHFSAFSTCYSTPTVLRSTLFAIMALSFIATCLVLIMATSVAPGTSMEAGNSGEITNSDFVRFVNSDTGRADLQASRLSTIDQLITIYGKPLIWKTLQKLWNSQALWSREPGCNFVHNYGLTWVEEVDNAFNYATGFYYNVRYSAKQWDQSTITAVDIPWDPTQSNYADWRADWAHDLSTMLFLTLFGALALDGLKLNGGERLMYRKIQLCKDFLREAYTAIERTGLLTDTLPGVNLELIERYVATSMTAGFFYMALPLNAVSYTHLTLPTKRIV